MKKIIPVFFIIILGFIVFFYYKQNGYSDKEKDSGGQGAKEQVDLVKLEKDYKESIRAVFNEYADNKDDIRQVTALKGRLLDLKVPTELKALHLNLVLTMTKTESYVQSGEEDDKLAVERIIKETREKYPWIN
ncbi:MAG: hypothetical protein AAB906_02535 [Patescibacteria group bacterium]